MLKTISNNISASDINGRCPVCGRGVLFFYWNNKKIQKVECRSCYWIGDMNDRI